MPTILINWKSRENALPIIEKDFFGPIYEFMPDLFEFTPGDRLQIINISEYVRKVTSSQQQYFKKIAVNQPIEDLQNAFAECSVVNRPHLLNKLIETADKNVQTKPGGYRFGNDEKSLATYLRMLVGPLAYETIHRNLTTAIPSLSSTNRYVQKMNCRVNEGILRCNELNLFLEYRNWPKIVSLSEDATRIVGRVQYDRKTNQVLGFVQPIAARNGMPIPFSFPARNAHEIMQYFDGTKSESQLVNVIMAQPIGLEASYGFCLMLFSSDNKYTSDDVCNRWKFIIDTLKELDITVLNFSSDSDPRYNAAMRKLSHLGCDSNLFGQQKWYQLGDMKSISNLGEFDTIFTQDTTHNGVKLRNLFLKTAKNDKKLPMGKYYIRQSHLKQLIDRFPKDMHNLTNSTLNPMDKQNFDSVKRICNNKVIELLRSKLAGSQGTIKFLEIMQYVIDSYMNETLSPLERVYKMWYSVFMLRLWRAFIVSRKKTTLKENFMSMNCYVCIELNAHSLLKMLLQLKQINMPNLFLTHQLGSQPCESLFRQCRSFTTTYSTVANCTVKEMLERISKIELQNNISSETGKIYSFPRIGQRQTDCVKVFELPSSIDIQNEIQKAKNNALNDAVSIGLVNKSTNTFDFACNINPYVNKQRKMSMPKSVLPNRIQVKFTVRLDKVTLKNFADQFEGIEIDNYSHFVELYRNGTTGKRIIVKKTSFVWLIRKDPVRLSSDRLERVKANTMKRKNHRGIHIKTKPIKSKQSSLFI